MKTTAKIIKCSCSHEFQDKEYGQTNRIHNKMKQLDGGNKQWRCTVCGKEKESAIVITP